MQADLAQFFGAAAEQIPTSRDEKAIFSTATLPRPPSLVVTDQLHIEKGLHDYHPGEFRADVLYFCAPRATYRQLGLLIMAVVLQAAPVEVCVELRHPASAIKQLIIESPYHGPDDIHSGYNTRPYLFLYSPHPTTRFSPWPEPQLDPAELPCFYLTNRADCVASEQDRENRDTVRGFGRDTGSMLFAELLLNASQPDNPLNEYDLEGDGGYRGVGYLSTEVKLWLPGSPGWDPTQWPGDE
jgi:hypothetical protein